MTKSKVKKRKMSKVVMCDPAVCDECLYICEGDFLCEKCQEIVVSDWEPTEFYMMCGGDPNA